MKSHSLAVRRLTKEYQMLLSKPVKNILAVPSPDNIFEWHFLIYDLDYPFKQGFYHGKLLFPVEYPNKPPNLIFLTPNGRFKPQMKICLSFTNYHPETWSIAWNIENMLVGLISFMYTNENTTGAVITSNSEKMKLAQKSLAYNLQNKEFQKVFKESFKSLGINSEKIKEINENTQKECENDGEFVKKLLFWILGIFLILLSYFYLVKK